VEDSPDGVEVGIFRFSNRYHSQPSDGSMTPELTGAGGQHPIIEQFDDERNAVPRPV
jgi:hypothetical protein